MNRWILAAAITLLAIASSCEKTVREPGEPEHGGVFLHSNGETPPTTQ